MRELADSIRTSLNFYRTQDAAETVELGVVTGAAVAIPGFVERLGEHAAPAARGARRRRRRRRRRRPPHGRRRPRRRRAPVEARASSAHVRHTARPMSVGVAAVVAAILGAIVGSFLNVVAYRLPRKESLLHPPSRVPACGTPIKPYDNVPGARAGCGCAGAAARAARRSRSRYPLVEAAHRACCAPPCVLRFGADSDVWLPLVFVLLLVPITLIDLEHHIIPNVLIGDRGGRRDRAGARLRLRRAGRAPDRRRSPPAASSCSPRSSTRPGMGMGDVKLAAVHGPVPGPRGRARDLRRADRRHRRRRRRSSRATACKEGRKKGIPFGPWLAFGSLVGLFCGRRHRRLVPRHLHVGPRP